MSQIITRSAEERVESLLIRIAEEAGTSGGSGSVGRIGSSGNEGTEAECAESSLPVIPSDVYEALPGMLGQLTAYFAKGYQRDTFLTASLGALSVVVSNARFQHADGWKSLNLYALITAMAGAGKGTAGFARKLVNTIDARIYDQSKLDLAEWNRRQKGEHAGEEPRPPIRSLVFGANSSSRALSDNLVANAGSGLIFETETAAAVNAFSQDWGAAARTMFLQNWQNEPILLERKGGEKHRIEHPQFGIVLTGTPDSARGLIQSADDGLFSRFIHYGFSAPPVWESHRPTERTNERDNALQRTAESLDGLHCALSARENPLWILFEDKQWGIIDSAFGDNLDALYRAGSDPLLYASVKRSAIIAERIASIMSILRHWEGNANLQDAVSIRISDDDCHIGVRLALTYLTHAITFAASLPQGIESTLSGAALHFYSALPNGAFGTAEYECAASAAGISDRQGRTYLKTFEGMKLVTKVKAGHYRKGDSGELPASNPSGTSKASKTTSDDGT